ncbi:MAG: T9SS type A sorting domain-containing protein [Candidatus Cloacimonetes bacterium]|nr:T9SS type A sorting domain-containing protein [Candidatus Cloacimonadota bacterium]
MLQKASLVILFVLSCTILLADGVQPEGDGTQADPYQVATLDNLLWVSTNNVSWSCHFIQTADIDATDTQNWNDGAGFSPIGTGALHDFSGSYNGQGYTIDGLYMNRPTNDCPGMFGIVTAITCDNLGLTNVEMTGHINVGGLVGYDFGGSTITNCYSTGSVSGTNDNIGGLVGTNGQSSTISNCYSTASVAGVNCVGCLAGASFGTIGDSYSTGSVNGTVNYIGGLVGGCSGSIINCYSTGSVNGISKVGGLVGYVYGSDGSVINCYSTGSVNGTENFIGGLVGSNASTVTSSFWDIETSGQTTSAGGTGLTTTEMQALATYIDAGWDFMEETANGAEDIWGLNYAENGGYPFLEWQGFAHDPPVSTADEVEAPLVTHLGFNYPNPFNPTTTIVFSIQRNETATLEIFNLRGQRVMSYPTFPAGNHEVVWDGTDNNEHGVVSGVFLYRLQSGSTQQVRKMLLLK